MRYPDLEKYASKGLLEDLFPYLESSAWLGRENVLETSEGNAYAILSDSAHREQVWDYLEYLILEKVGRLKGMIIQSRVQIYLNEKR